LNEFGIELGSLDVELAAAKLSLAAGHLASVERELTALRSSRYRLPVVGLKANGPAAHYKTGGEVVVRIYRQNWPFCSFRSTASAWNASSLGLQMFGCE
jgi:hypothetical protein